ncbi:hypothetical protein GF374_02700 [Candidatus Woesearchaeota archaeon]|nr:hypothetical protein [Candidatus Woesearchaeota archaeon]
MPKPPETKKPSKKESFPPAHAPGIPKPTGFKSIKPLTKPKPMHKLKTIPKPGKAKVFVRIDKYRDVVKTLDSMQHKLMDLQRTLDKISSIKDREAEIISGWHALLAEAKDKIDHVDSELTEPEA